MKQVEEITFTVEKEIDPNCQKCHGKGYTGRTVGTHNFIICPCIINSIKKKREAGVKYKTKKYELDDDVLINEESVLPVKRQSIVMGFLKGLIHSKKRRLNDGR